MPNFTPDQARELFAETINLNLRHAGYGRTVALRADYLTILTGVGFERFLTRFVRREDAEEYAQRLTLTFQNLSSTATPLMKKAGQISRIQDIKKGLNFTGTSERDQRDLQDVLNDFGGEGSSRRGSLDDYLAEHYDSVSQYDPNAFVLLDYAPFRADLGERARPYAVLFECSNVLNFRYTRGSLDYLLTRIAIPYKDPDGARKIVTDYLLYGPGFTLRYYHVAEGRTDLPETFDTFRSVADILYRIVEFSPGGTEPAAVRLGDLPDIETGGLTCISRLLHACVDQFRELINLKSQNDIVSRKHGWPRQYERAPLCPGEVTDGGLRAPCNGGINSATGQTCKACGGSGFETHRSEQDTVRMGLTGNETAEDLFDLSKLIFVQKPELETVESYDKKIADKRTEIYVTAFSTDQQIKAQGPSKTATEYVVSREDQNNTLLPIADYKSVVYKSFVRFTVTLMQISGEVEVLYEFPRDLKLSSMDELYAVLKVAREAKVGFEQISQIIDDINRKQYEADPSALKRYFIKKQHCPYVGLSLEDIEYANASGMLLPDMVFIYFNSDIIFGELEIENPLFYDEPYQTRDKQVSAKVEKLRAKLPRTVDLSAGIRQLNSHQQQTA